MSTFVDRLRIILDVEGQKAEAALKSVRDRMREAEGATAKMKVGFAAARDVLVSPAGLTTAAVTAGAVATKLASDFSQLGVRIGLFSDATGTSADEASRWVEVAGDLGIGADALQTVMGRLNKNIDPAAFKEYGITIARTATGVVDANQTFLNTIDALHRMKDPTQQAEAAAKLFGRGWQQVAEIIGMSTQDIQKRLAEVDKGKLFDDARIAKARDFRDAIDKMRDSIEAIATDLGEGFAPALAQTAEQIGAITDMVGGLDDAVKSLTGGMGVLDELNATGNMLNPFSWVSDAAESITGVSFGDIIGVVKDEIVGASDAAGEAFDTAAYGASIAAKNAMEFGNKTVEALRSQESVMLDLRRATLANMSAQANLEGAYRSTVDSLGQLGATMAAGEKSTYDQASATLAARQAVLSYVQQLADVPPSKVTEILAMIDKGNLQGALDALNALTKPRIIPLVPRISPLGARGPDGEKIMPSSTAKSIGDQIVTDVNDAITAATKSGGGSSGGKSLGKSVAQKTREELLAEKDNLKADMFEMGEVSAANYRKYLAARLKDYKKYSDDYMRVWREIKDLDDAKATADKKAADEAKKAREAAQAAKAREASDAQLQQALNIGTVIVQTAGDTPRRWLDELAWRVS